MKLPGRFIAGNLIWTREASVWAVYRVEPAPYPWMARHEKLRLHQQSRAALMALPGEAMVLSLCLPIPAGELSRRMCPGRAEAGDAPEMGTTAPEVAMLAHSASVELEPTERILFVAAELPARRPGGDIGVLAGSIRALVAQPFGLPGQAAGPAEVERYGRRSHHLLTQLRTLLPLREATAEEVCWIYASAVRRGKLWAGGQAGPFPGPSGAGRGGAGSGPRLVAIADAIFKEGGTPSDANRPVHRRYLRVDTDAGVGYQALLAMSGMPHAYRFPDGGGEWLLEADRAGFPVDWCLRIHPVPNRAAQASARRQARQLRSQVGEYDGDPAGAPPALAEALDALDDLRAHLAASPADDELQVTTIFAVASRALDGLEEQASALQGLYAAGEYELHRPIGGQLGLFQAMLPGSASRSPARDYVHHLLCRDLAAGMPFAGVAVGDPEGMLLGYSLDAGTFRPVLFDAAYGPGINRSGSLGAFGALGSGKSYFIKNVLHATLARGGRVAVLDRSTSGEYARLAPVVPVASGRAQVVALGARSAVCLDPLRVFTGEDRIGFATGFLALIAGTAPGDLQGIALAEAVRAVAARSSGRLCDVISVLEAAAASDPHAEAAWRSLRNASHNPLASFAFGDGEVAGLDADYLVFHAPGLSLPDREAVLREHLASRLLPEQILSQAILYLIAAVARQVTFSDPGRFAAALFDEAWCLTSSLQGRALLLDGIRDGRKHNAAVWLLSQHPNDLGDDEIAHLLGPRFVFRQAPAAAAAALHFAGVEPSERAASFLSSAPEGACLFRDVRDRVGSIQILPAMSGRLHDAFETNPLTARPRLA